MAFVQIADVGEQSLSRKVFRKFQWLIEISAQVASGRLLRAHECSANVTSKGG